MVSSVSALEALQRENESLRRALRVLHQLANLVRAADEPRATRYAVLTGITAGIGLGLNRAMMFVPCPDEPGVLEGAAAVGPSDRIEADRVWRAIEAEKPDLKTLYEAGLRNVDTPSELDRRVRTTRVEIARSPRSPLVLALDRPICAEGDDDLGGLLHPPTTLAAPMRGRDGWIGVLLADKPLYRAAAGPDHTARLRDGRRTCWARARSSAKV